MTHGIPTPFGARPINEIMADVSQEVYRPNSDAKFQELVDELHSCYTKEEVNKFAQWMNENA